MANQLVYQPPQCHIPSAVPHMCSSYDGLINPLGGSGTQDECVQACRNILWPGAVSHCAPPAPTPSTSAICFLPSSLA